MRTFALSLLLPAASAQLIWQQSEDIAIYTSASISRHAGAPPTFACATDLNDPIFVEAFNVSDSGENVWSFADARHGASFAVQMARHTEGVAAGAALDTFALSTPPPGGDGCVLRAWSSLGSGVPAWTFNRSSCSAYGFSVSDDGSAVVLSAGLDIGQPKLAPVVWLLDAQTGAPRWTVGGNDASQFGGDVMISKGGAYIAYTRGDDTVEVLDGATGAVRGQAIPMGWNTVAQLSDSGDFLAFSGQDKASIYQWSAASGAYTLAYSVTPSGSSNAWYSESTAVSSDGSGSEGGELACFGYIGAGALSARVLIVSMATGAVLSDYTTPANTQLQTSTSLKMDGSYCGVALWGDRDDMPTAILLAAGNSTPAFTYTTPGSSELCAARARAFKGAPQPCHPSHPPELLPFILFSVWRRRGCGHRQCVPRCGGQAHPRKRDGEWGGRVRVPNRRVKKGVHPQ